MRRRSPRSGNEDLLAAAALISAAAFLNGCCPHWCLKNEVLERGQRASVHLDARHSPLHPGDHEEANFTLRITGAGVVQKVELFVYEYDLPESQPGERTFRRGGLQKSWSEPDFRPTTARPDEDPSTESFGSAFEWSHPSGFDRRTLVTYEFLVSLEGGAQTYSSVSFAAGEWPWANLPIPVYLQGDDPKRQIDVCFVPDGDYYASSVPTECRAPKPFVLDVENLIYSGYLANNAIREGQNRWSFYYTPRQGVAVNLQLPSGASELNGSEIDAFGILHNCPLDDVRNNRVFSSESDNFGTAVHETAHVAFDLADEYCCSWANRELEGESNLFDTEQECVDHTVAHGWKVKCQDFYNSEQGKTWYRPEPLTEDCVMRDDAVNGFHRSCRLIVHRRYGK